MKSVTAAYLGEFAKRFNKALVRVQYQRRYNNGSAIVNESTWHTIPQSDLAGIGAIPWNLDTDFYSVYQSTTITLQMENSRGQWYSTAGSASIFGPDAVSPAGYYEEKTSIRIQWGYKLPDGTTEYVNLFTGVLIDVQPTSDKNSVAVVVQDNSYLMQTQTAMKVTDVVTGVCTAQGDGTTTSFTTTDTGLAYLTQVTVATVAINTTLWGVSGVDQPGAATVTLSNPPVLHATIGYTGVKYKQNITLDALVADLCDAAGITSGMRNIVPAIFPGLAGSKTLKTQADWQTATLSLNMDTVTTPNVLTPAWVPIDDFVAAGLPNWSTTLQGSGSADNPGGEMRVIAPGVSDSVLARKVGNLDDPSKDSKVGGWAWACSIPTIAVHGYVVFNMIGGSVTTDPPFGPGLATGFSLCIGYLGTGGASTTTPSVTLYRNGSSPVYLGTWSATSAIFSAHTWIVTRDASGLITVYMDGSQVLQASDSTVYMYGNPFIVWVQGAGGGTSTELLLTGAWHSYSTAAAVLSTTPTSAPMVTEYEFNLLAAPSALGVITTDANLNSGGIVIKTATAVDVSGSPGTFDTLVALGPSGQMMSPTPRQWLKVRIEMTQYPSYLGSPSMDLLTANFMQSTIFLTVAVHRDKTVWDMVQRYAQACGYEVGFDCSGNFFFRPKTVGATPIIRLTGANAISKISKYETGIQKVINAGVVDYSGNTIVYDSAAAGDAFPNSEDINGRIEKRESFTDLYFANDANLALARAIIIFTQNKLKARRVTFDCRMLAHLELGDVFIADYREDPKSADNIAGDPLQQSGSAGPASQIMIDNVIFKAISLIPNPDNAGCQLQGLEVPS